MNSNYDLLFPLDRTADVLSSVGALAAEVGAHRTGLVLPDGCLVTLPFSSWYGDGKMLPLMPGTKVRLDAILCLAPAGGRDALDRLYIRLWVFLGERYAKLSFFAPDAKTSRLFKKSDILRAKLAQLLSQHGGLLGMLDVDQEVAYLLPDLDRSIEPPQVLRYYDKDLQVCDVDRWAGDVLRLEPRACLPPGAGRRRRTARDREIDALLKPLEAALNPVREPLPVRYHRTFEDRPFDSCDYCHKPLLVPYAGYVITKLVIEGELRQEIAMCTACHQGLTQRYSDESRAVLDRTFSGIMLARRQAVPPAGGSGRVEVMTRHCLLCGVDRAKTTAYVEYAACESNEIVYGEFPYMLCEQCLRAVHMSLSEQTREERGRFDKEHFGFPPPGAPARERVYELSYLSSPD